MYRFYVKNYFSLDDESSVTIEEFNKILNLQKQVIDLEYIKKELENKKTTKSFSSKFGSNEEKYRYYLLRDLFPIIKHIANDLNANIEDISYNVEIESIIVKVKKNNKNLGKQDFDKITLDLIKKQHELIKSFLKYIKNN